MTDERIEEIRRWHARAAEAPGLGMCGEDADALVDDVGYLLDHISQLEGEQDALRAEVERKTAAIETALARFAEWIGGEQYDDSWMRPLRLPMEQRKQAYLHAVETLRAALEGKEK